MNYFASIYDYCIQKKGVTETFPFNEEVLVFKVMGKMFALMNINQHPLRINLKCDPEWAISLRENHADIEPGYHMSKKYWNTVTIDGNLEMRFLFELIDHSYELVVQGLKKADRETLLTL